RELNALALPAALPIWPAPRAGGEDAARPGGAAARLRRVGPAVRRGAEVGDVPLRRGRPPPPRARRPPGQGVEEDRRPPGVRPGQDRKSTRLNSSHSQI